MKKVFQMKDQMLWQWKLIEYLSCTLIFLIPLYFNNNHLLFSFSAPKTIVIIGLILLMIIFYAWGLLVLDRITFRFTPLHIVLGFFLLVLTISSIWGVDPLNSFFGKWIDGINLILIYVLAIFSLFLGFLIKKNKLFISRIMLVSFASSICVALIAYTGSSLLFFFKNGDSTIGNNSYTGAYLLFNTCFGIGLFLYYSKIWQKILIFFGFLLIIFSQVLFNKDILVGKIGLLEVIHKPFLLFGQANAADVGLIFSLFVIAFLFLIFSSKKIYRIAGTSLLVILFIGIFYGSLQLTNQASSLHRVYIEAKGENRFVSWDIAKLSYIDKPLLGSGFNNFSYSYQKYFSPEILKESRPEFYFYQPHNIIWEYSSNNGLLGLISFLSLLFFTFFALFKHQENEEKKYRDIKIVVIGSLFGYFIQNLFGFDTPVTYLMLFLVIGLAIGQSQKDYIIQISDKYKILYKIKASFLIFLSLILITLFVIFPFLEFKKMGKLISVNNINQRIEIRKNVQEISLLGGVFDSSYLAGKFYDLYVSDIGKINDSNRSLFLNEIESTVDRVEKDTKKQPNAVYSHIIITSLLNMEMFINGSVDQDIWNRSFGHIKKAVELNPQNPENYLLLAQTCIIKKDFINAYISLRRAIEIAPTYQKSYEYADRILKIMPDKVFEKYISDMKNKGINNIK